MQRYPLHVDNYWHLLLFQSPSTSVYVRGEVAIYLAQCPVLQEWAAVLFMTPGCLDSVIERKPVDHNNQGTLTVVVKSVTITALNKR